jgi:hypothetical protein
MDDRDLIPARAGFYSSPQRPDFFTLYKYTVLLKASSVPCINFYIFSKYSILQFENELNMTKCNMETSVLLLLSSSEI